MTCSGKSLNGGKSARRKSRESMMACCHGGGHHDRRDLRPKGHLAKRPHRAALDLANRRAATAKVLRDPPLVGGVPTEARGRAGRGHSAVTTRSKDRTPIGLVREIFGSFNNLPRLPSKTRISSKPLVDGS